MLHGTVSLIVRVALLLDCQSVCCFSCFDVFFVVISAAQLNKCNILRMQHFVEPEFNLKKIFHSWRRQHQSIVSLRKLFNRLSHNTKVNGGSIMVATLFISVTLCCPPISYTGPAPSLPLSPSCNSLYLKLITYVCPVMTRWSPVTNTMTSCHIESLRWNACVNSQDYIIRRTFAIIPKLLPHSSLT